MIVNCAIDGCSSQYESNENPSPNGVRYVCAHHTSKELRAAGVLKTARVDKDVHFQTIAFDRDLGRRTGAHWTHPLPERPGLYESGLTTDAVVASTGQSNLPIVLPNNDESK